MQVAVHMGVDPDSLHGGSNSSSSCDVNTSDPLYQLRERVQAETANWEMYTRLASFLPGLIMPIIIAAVSDKRSRRIMLIIPCIGSMLTALNYMAMVYFNLPIYFFFLNSIEYVFGGMGVLFAGVFAYLADTVPPEKRAFRMTVIDVVSMSNGAIANLFVGYWIKAQGYFWPLTFVTGGKTLALLYAIFLVPETIHSAPGASQKIGCEQLKTGVAICYKDNGTGRRMPINLLLASYAVTSILSSYGILTLFEMNAPMCWNSIFIGYYSATSIIVKCLAVLLVAKLLAGRIKDIWQIFFAKLSSICEYTYLAFVSSTLMMFFGKFKLKFIFPNTRRFHVTLKLYLLT